MEDKKVKTPITEVKSEKQDLNKIESKKTVEKSAEDKVVSEIEEDILEPEKKKPSLADVVAKTLAKAKKQGLDKSKNV